MHNKAAILLYDRRKLMIRIIILILDEVYKKCKKSEYITIICKYSKKVNPFYKTLWLPMKIFLIQNNVLIESRFYFQHDSSEKSA